MATWYNKHSDNYVWDVLRDKVRGVLRPVAATLDAWDAFDAKLLSERPIRFFLADILIPKIEDIATYIPHKMCRVRSYYIARFKFKTHCLMAHPSDLKPGQWCDLTGRLLPCMFNSLVDFVELELPDDKSNGMPKKRRSHHNSEMLLKKRANDKDSHEAEQYKELLALYHWWTVVYKGREDPHDLVGFNTGYEFDLRAKQPWYMPEMLAKLNEIEALYAQEEEDMMVRLIKLRHTLWT